MSKSGSSAVKVAPKNGNLARSLNTLKTVPGAPNPFVVNPRRASSQGSSERGGQLETGSR